MRLILRTMIVSLCLSACTGAFEAEPQGAVNKDMRKPAAADLKGPSADSFGYVVIGVTDMDQALGLWVRRFGMEVADRRRGEDPGLSRVWGLSADGIVDQALLNTPGLIDGGVHLVQFASPRAPVRQGAASFDPGLSGVYIAVRDILARHRELQAAGLRSRSGVDQLAVDGSVTKAARMTTHGGVDIVLFERADAKWPTSRQGYAVTPHAMAVVADLDAEVAFFERALGLEVLERHRFSGTAAETIFGAPKGGAVDANILGGPESRFGRIKLIQYEGASGDDFDSRMEPPALGLLSLTYVVPDLAPIIERGAAFGAQKHGRVRSILGEGDMLSLESPAGIRIDIIEQ